uniref:Uncharacterized protein n=1 Tax=Pyrodinium bahamense TaxID=73915 RepID=A0A7S0B898_9DINO
MTLAMGLGGERCPGCGSRTVLDEAAGATITCEVCGVEYFPKKASSVEEHPCSRCGVLNQLYTPAHGRSPTMRCGNCGTLQNFERARELPMGRFREPPEEWSKLR